MLYNTTDDKSWFEGNAVMRNRLVQSWNSQHKQGKIKGAIRCYRKALALDNSEQLQLHATTNLAQDLLLNGEWSEGFEIYEQRIKYGKTDFSMYRKLFGKPWCGSDDPRPCQRLLVVGEQGYGDTLQFYAFPTNKDKR